MHGYAAPNYLVWEPEAAPGRRPAAAAVAMPAATRGGVSGSDSGAPVGTSQDSTRGVLLEDKLKQVASQWFAHLEDYVLAYSHSGALLVPWGGDFTFDHAAEMFGNMTALIDYVNRTPGKSWRIRRGAAMEFPFFFFCLLIMIHRFFD